MVIFREISVRSSSILGLIWYCKEKVLHGDHKDEDASDNSMLT